MVVYMKSFKNHFSVIVSLFVLLCSFECVILINKIIKNYEKNLIDDYSIVIVSKKELDKDGLLKKYSNIKSVDEIDSSNIISKFNENNIVQNISFLKEAMPNFYNIKLNTFPTTSVANNLKKQLLGHDNIDKVEIFSKTYDKVYKVLQLLHIVVLFFTCIVCLISVLLIFKQLRIWIYEHEERVSIMTLFGAPFWTKSASLYKMVIIDSILAAFLANILFLFYSKSGYLQKLLLEINIDFPNFDIFKDGAILLLISFIFAIFSTTYTVIRAHK